YSTNGCLSIINKKSGTYPKNYATSGVVDRLDTIRQKKLLSVDRVVGTDYPISFNVLIAEFPVSLIPDVCMAGKSLILLRLLPDRSIKSGVRRLTCSVNRFSPASISISTTSSF
ncbi:MAG: hypothetical protein ACN4GW_19740, partial [Desulforhopalus sp.]